MHHMYQILVMHKSCYESRGKQDAKELTSLATWQVLLQEDWLLVETSSHAARGLLKVQPQVS